MDKFSVKYSYTALVTVDNVIAKDENEAKNISKKLFDELANNVNKKFNSRKMDLCDSNVRYVGIDNLTEWDKI